ncbi:hypothetical protein MOKP64_12460 [Mycobacterium avium subsp. hominissuis]
MKAKSLREQRLPHLVLDHSLRGAVSIRKGTLIKPPAVMLNAGQIGTGIVKDRNFKQLSRPSISIIGN